MSSFLRTGLPQGPVTAPENEMPHAALLRTIGFEVEGRKEKKSGYVRSVPLPLGEASAASGARPRAHRLVPLDVEGPRGDLTTSGEPRYYRRDSAFSDPAGSLSGPLRRSTLRGGR